MDAQASKAFLLTSENTYMRSMILNVNNAGGVKPTQ